MTPLLVLVALARAGSAAPADVGRIDSVCRATEVASRGSQGLVRVFAETSGAVLPKPRQGDWRELDTEAALQALADGERPPNTEAVVRTTAHGHVRLDVLPGRVRDLGARRRTTATAPSARLARVRGTFNSYQASSRARAFAVAARRTSTRRARSSTP